jgi:transposase
LKGLRYLLIKKDAQLTVKERERLAELKRSHPDLYQLTRLRQKLYEWYETDTSPGNAKIALEQWLVEAAQLKIKALDSFCNTLLNWMPEILNFFNQRVTSGFVEGMNCKIRLIKRLAFGLPNFDHFRLRVLLVCG